MWVGSDSRPMLLRGLKRFPESEYVDEVEQKLQVCRATGHEGDLDRSVLQASSVEGAQACRWCSMSTRTAPAQSHQPFGKASAGRPQ